MANSTAMNLDMQALDEKQVQADVSKEFGFETGEVQYDKVVDPALAEHAQKQVDMIWAAAQSVDEAEKARVSEMVEGLGLAIQKRAVGQNEFLRVQIRKLHGKLESSNKKKIDIKDMSLDDILMSLRDQAQDLDPSNVDFSTPSRWARTLPSWMGGQKLSRYFQKFESAQTVLDAIFKGLEKSAEQIGRDTSLAKSQQLQMKEFVVELKKVIALGMLMKKSFDEKLQNLNPDSEEAQYLRSEILFAINQRIIDLQKTQAVIQQAIISLEICIRDNRELKRASINAQTQTRIALETAVALSVVLLHQRIVLDKIELLNQTTDNLISYTADKLGQAVDFHKRAAESGLDAEKLKENFRKINAVITAIDDYRSNALDGQSKMINDLDDLSKEASESIERMDRGNKARAAAKVDDDGADAPARGIDLPR